jgi:hypothetical protein
LHALRGRFVHKNIIKAAPFEHEYVLGAVTHYLLGASLALTYPALYLVFGEPVPGNHVIPGLLWGLATTLLPWMILYPVFGWGFFGVTAPPGTRPVLSPTVSHLVYGLGLGIVLNVVTQHWSI